MFGCVQNLSCEYVMNFGKDIQKASLFTEQVLTQVFGYSLDMLTFKIG